MLEIWQLDEHLWFPPAHLALKEPNGLLAIGGDLSPERLKLAYRQGIFPWFSEGEPLLWWSPAPRMVLFPAEVKISRSLRKRLKRGDFQVTYNQAFSQVIHACAELRRKQGGTWITPEMEAAYTQLHQEGAAQSVEVWQAQALVGGLYGVTLGRVFFGESMFSRVSDASKVAFVSLAQRLNALEFSFVDCQMYSSHLASLGAREISRVEFSSLLKQGVKGDQQFIG